MVIKSRYLESLLRHLRSRFFQCKCRIGIFEPTPCLALLKLHSGSLARADAHPSSPRAAANRTAGAAPRAAVRVVDTAAHGELVAVALPDPCGAGVDGCDIVCVLPYFELRERGAWCCESGGDRDWVNFVRSDLLGC